jgi:hypothetical protein
LDEFNIDGTEPWREDKALLQITKETLLGRVEELDATEFFSA